MKPVDIAISTEAAEAYEAQLAAWESRKNIERIWAREASVWTGSDEAQWLGWLTIAKEQLAERGRFTQFADEVKKAGFTHGVVLGMGGSSLCPEVLRLSFGHIQGFPDFQVLDSTDPGRVAAIESKLDVPRTLFIVASKSGSTLEPNIFHAYFYERSGRNGRQFVAITDPGSHMEKIAEADGFWKIFYGVPSIGGRFSALSNFGMIPAAAMGIDAGRLLEAAQEMAHACRLPIRENPGGQLGLLMGTLAWAGRDKVTIVTSPSIHDLGAWLEQLIAESTGKEGKALIPVDREPLGAPDVYGRDRVFVYLYVETQRDVAQDKAIDALAAAGQPVIRIALKDAHDLGREFFRWEFATAVAGSVIGINPFNQPDVESAKVAARKLTSAFEETGKLPEETPAVKDGGITVYGGTNATTLDGSLRGLFATIRPGDYFGLLAYIEMNEANERILESIRTRIRDAKHVATCVGFGPRFLHSTGQAYKGGPNTGVFLQITCDHARDLPVPGKKYSFGVVEAAQARGDLEVMIERGRRALRIHLGTDIEGGLQKLAASVDRALQ